MAAAAVAALFRVWTGWKASRSEQPRYSGGASARTLPGEEAIVAARRFPSSLPMPLPLPQADELLEVPRRPQEQGRPKDLHPVEEEADPSVDAVEGEVRERAHVKEHRGRGGGGVERQEEPVVRRTGALPSRVGPTARRFRHGHAVEERERSPRDDDFTASIAPWYTRCKRQPIPFHAAR